MEDEEKIRPWEYLRYTAVEYAEKFWVNRKEISERVPENMDEIVTLKNWYHLDNIESRPSDMETFQKLAVILSEKNYEDLETIKKGIGNTHWKNWPLGGTL